MARYKSSPGSASVGIAEIAQITSRHTNRCLYTTPGSYTYTVPSGVTSILAVAVGPGSKPVEGLKCVDLMTCGTIDACIVTQYLHCCCNTCVKNCCTPIVCYANACTAGSTRVANTGAYPGGIVDPTPGANTHNKIVNQCHGGCISSYKPLLISRYANFCYNSCNIGFCGTNNYSRPTCYFCRACMTVHQQQDVEYFFTKAPGFGGGYSEKTMTVVPAQSVNVVVGCWNCNNSFSCVTANSTVHICATGPKLCRRQLPMVKGPYLGIDTVTGQCYWEDCLANRPVQSVCNCSTSCKCCGKVQKCMNHSGVHTWKNDYGFVTRQGQGYNGDMNRAGGGTVITYSGSFNTTGKPKATSEICKTITTCHLGDNIGIWAICCDDITCGTNACMCCLCPGFRTDNTGETVMGCTAATNGTFAGFCNHSNAAALNTCYYQFAIVSPWAGYGNGTEFSRSAGSCKVIGDGPQCNCCWERRMGGSENMVIAHGSYQRPTISGGSICTSGFNSVVQRNANTPGFINQFNICGCVDCIKGRYVADNNVCFDTEAMGQELEFVSCQCSFHFSANPQSGSTQGCCNCCYFYYGHTKVLNTIADECFKFGGSSAGNHYGDGVSSISDATYGVCGPLVYGCDALLENPGTGSGTASTGARSYNCVHPAAMHDWCRPSCISGACFQTLFGANPFYLAGNTEVETMTCTGCGSFLPYGQHFGTAFCTCQQGSACFAHNQIGYKQDQFRWPFSVYGIENSCAMCSYPAVDVGGTCSSDRMKGYMFYASCYCECDMAIENDIWFPYAVSGDYSGGILGNPLLDLKGSRWRWGLGEVVPVIDADSRPRCCTVSGNGCCIGDSQYQCQSWCHWATGCSYIRVDGSCRPPRPHSCSCYRYRSQIFHTGSCLKVAGADGASYATTPRASNTLVQTAICNNGASCQGKAHQLYTLVQHMKCSNLGNGMGSADQAVSCYACYSFCFEGKQCNSSSGICYCMRVRNMLCNNAFCCGHNYWPERTNFDLFSANTTSSDEFALNTASNSFRLCCTKPHNHNPLISVYDNLCVWQTWYGDESDDSYPDANPGAGDNSTYCSRPESAWGSAAYNPNCYQSNAQVQLVIDERQCKEALAWQYLGPWSHRSISMMMEGFCCYTAAHYNANVLTCPFRSVDRVSVYDQDFYNQFVHAWKLQARYGTNCYCFATSCMCCGIRHAWYMAEIKPTACVTRTVGSTTTDLDTLTAQGGAGTATPGVWNSCCGGDGGIVTSVTVTAGGSDYTEVPFICATGGGGCGFIGKAILTPSCTNYACCIGSTGIHVRDELTGGSVTGVEVICGGAGYTSAPTLRVCGGNGTGAAITAVVSDFTSNKSFGSGGGTITGTLYNAKCVKVTDSAAVQSVVLGRGGRGCEPEAPAYFSSYPGISTTITNPTDPSEPAFDAVTGCQWFDTRQILGSGGNGCFTSGVFGIVNAQNPGPGGGGGVGCDVLGNLIGCGGVLAGGSGCCGDGGIGGGAGRCGTPGNGMVVIYWTPS